MCANLTCADNMIIGIKFICVEYFTSAVVVVCMVAWQTHVSPARQDSISQSVILISKKYK